MKDYYYILGIESDVSENEIKKAYRKLSIKFHPDKNSGDKFFENRFKEIQEAYETLSNKDKRILYDSKLKNRNSKDSENQKNRNVGEIIGFESSKTIVINNQEITLFWATKNMVEVKLSCFQTAIPHSGKKSLRIKAKENKIIPIKLSAIDINGIKSSRVIKLDFKLLNNKTQILDDGLKIRQSKSRLNYKPLIWILTSFLILTFIFVVIQNKSKDKIDTAVSQKDYENNFNLKQHKESANFLASKNSSYDDIDSSIDKIEKELYKFDDFIDKWKGNHLESVSHVYITKFPLKIGDRQSYVLLCSVLMDDDVPDYIDYSFHYRIIMVLNKSDDDKWEIVNKKLDPHIDLHWNDDFFNITDLDNDGVEELHYVEYTDDSSPNPGVKTLYIVEPNAYNLVEIFKIQGDLKFLPNSNSYLKYTAVYSSDDKEYGPRKYNVAKYEFNGKTFKVTGSSITSNKYAYWDIYSMWKEIYNDAYGMPNTYK